jgi:L-alanine-DL-glutamate epimerase-like enolase superfamily enzyme
MSPSIIDRVQLIEFTFEAANLDSSDSTGRTLLASYKKGGSVTLTRYAVVIETADGQRGEYVACLVGNRMTLAQSAYLAPHLIGRNAEQRELIYDDLKREIRQFDHMGHGVLDIALWDLAGKKYGCSVSSMLGGYRTRLPAYASTFHGDRTGGLSSKEDYADFAEQCYELGYRAFKIHGWNEGNAREEAENVLHVASRVGDRMGLMLDPACQLRTFADTLYVGRACDEAGYLWYEDPMRDAATSAFSANKLRQMIKTPLLLTEHVRGVEPKADFIIAGGTDILRADPEYDLGITGTMKIAHLAEALGVDVELHAPGPAHRACMSAIRNTNYYEVALVGPKVPNIMPPVYADGYSDMLECVDADGCVGVPTGPGLGVTYDWDYINAHTVNTITFGKTGH